jgi:hypothetical protein
VDRKINKSGTGLQMVLNQFQTTLLNNADGVYNWEMLSIPVRQKYYDTLYEYKDRGFGLIAKLNGQLAELPAGVVKGDLPPAGVVKSSPPAGVKRQKQ